jgi:spore germination protein
MVDDLTSGTWQCAGANERAMSAITSSGVSVFTLLFLACASQGAISADYPVHSASRPTVYAWFPAQFGSWKTDGIDWDCLTHLCFRSVELEADGKVRRVSGDPPRDFVETAHRHGVKVTVLVWTRSKADSDGYLAGFPHEAANNLLAYVKKNNLDGLNIDDEQMGVTNAVAQAPNRELVTRFFRTLQKTFKSANPDYHLSFAAPPVIAAKDRFGTSWLDLKAIAEAVDAIIPMGYTQNPPTAGWASNPEPLSGGGHAAWTATRDIETMVGDYLEAMGSHKEKLLAGVSLTLGGYEWRCRTEAPLSPTLDKGAWRSLAECEAKMRQHGARWEDAQKSPWYCYRDGDAFVQGWYNDARAWNAKLDWVREQGLGGIGVWVLDGAQDPPDMWRVLRQFAGTNSVERRR